MRLMSLVVGELETNCYILKFKTSALIIDPGAEAEKIIQTVSETPVQMILATHRHYDHVDAMEIVKKATGATALIHALDWLPGFDQEIKDGQVLKIEQERISVIHTPGHTPGGCCFLIENFLFSGDTLFPGGYGNTTFPGGNQEAILASIREKLMKLPDTTHVYPGHGPPTTIGREKALYG